MATSHRARGACCRPCHSCAAHRARRANPSTWSQTASASSRRSRPANASRGSLPGFPAQSHQDRAYRCSDAGGPAPAALAVARWRSPQRAARRWLGSAARASSCHAVSLSTLCAIQDRGACGQATRGRRGSSPSRRRGTPSAGRHRSGVATRMREGASCSQACSVCYWVRGAWSCQRSTRNTGPTLGLARSQSTGTARSVLRVRAIECRGVRCAHKQLEPLAGKRPGRTRTQEARKKATTNGAVT